MQRMAVLLATFIVATACGGGGPTDGEVRAAVSEALTRLDVAFRVLDPRIATAEGWRLVELSSVALLAKPVKDGEGHWKVRVAMRGVWSGRIQIATGERPTEDAEGRWIPAPVRRKAVTVPFDAVADVRLRVEPDGGFIVP